MTVGWPDGTDHMTFEVGPSRRDAVPRSTAVEAEDPWAGMAALEPPDDPIVMPAESQLHFRSLADLCVEVDAAGPRRYLIRGIWPAGAYGVHAAEMKAQKTWNATDLAVSVASGTDWLGEFPIDAPGSVLMFAGEGGPESVVRRLRAICASRGLKAETLPIVVCTRAPHLTDDAHMAEFTRQVQQQRPRLVVLDPLYLSAGGASGSDLYAMGRVLEQPQHLCEQAGAALFIVTHFNRRAGRGAGRFTGAGPAEWGRVLISGTVLSRHTDPATKATTVIAELDIIGGEVADQTIKLRRNIVADNPDDLNGALHYAVAVLPAGDSGGADSEDIEPGKKKLWEALQAQTRPVKSRALVDAVAEKHGHGLTRPTVSKYLNELRRDGAADEIDQGAGRPKLWMIKADLSGTCHVTGHTTPPDTPPVYLSPRLYRGDGLQVTGDGSRTTPDTLPSDEWSAPLRRGQYGSDRP